MFDMIKLSELREKGTCISPDVLMVQTHDTPHYQKVYSREGN